MQMSPKLSSFVRLMPGCHSLCKSCVTNTADGCLQCHSEQNRHLLNSECKCLPHYQDIGEDTCEPICGDLQAVGQEQCDDGNSIRFDGCHNCLYECQAECIDCSFGTCLVCDQDFTLNPVTHKCRPIGPQAKFSLTLTNSPICGDGQLEGDEQCEDGNLIAYDGCFNCQFHCTNHCQICTYGICQQCQQDYNLDFSSQSCVPVDTKLTSILAFEKQCEDHNLGPFDGCFNSEYSCSEHCLTCINGYCSVCQANYQLDTLGLLCISDQVSFSSLVYIEEQQCQDFNQHPFDGCYANQYSCSEHCSSCINGRCTQCDKGYKINFFQKLCRKENSSSSLIYLIEHQCQDDNFTPFDGCFDHQYSCTEYCQTCVQGVCENCLRNYQFNILSQSCTFIEDSFGQSVTFQNQEDEQDQQNCSPTCKECVRGQCLSCYSELNVQLDEFSNKCFFDCQFEVNGKSFSNLDQINYRNCGIQCPKFCANCFYGQCLECHFGYSLVNGLCSSFCGDGVLKGFEECDDGNNEQFDGCYHCVVQCSEDCQICSSNTCYSCNLGWGLNSITRNCETICGDGLVKGAEFCDDGNDIPYDGCHECNYQCQQECEYCYYGVCYQCQEGFQSILEKCNPICGDGIVIGTEVCDDANDIPYDGCFECQYQCQKECLDCYEGICLECEDGYSLKGELCYSFCGDGIIAYGVEECDDFNNSDGDGCSQNCKIESGWTCSSSGCEITAPPLMYLDVVKEGNQIKLVNIQFTQKVIATTLQVDFIIRLTSNELTQDDFIDKLNNYQSHTLELQPLYLPSIFVQQEVIYQVTIDYIKNCYASELEVEMVDQNELKNYQNQAIGNKLVKVKLKPTNFLNESQKIVSSSINSIVNNLFYGIIVLFGVSALSGNLNLMWNTMDLLQFFSYLKYINVPFPLNLQQFFYIFDQMSLKPVLDFIGFNSFLSLLYGSNIVYIQHSKRFADEEINALFMDNISSILFVIWFGYVFHYFELCFFYILKQIQLNHYLLSRQFNIIKFILFLKEELHLEIESFYYSEILRIFISSSYEIYFSIYLQLSSFELNSKLIIFNLALCCICFLLVNIVTISVLFMHQYKETQFEKPSLKQFKSLFEDINRHSYFSSIFNSLCLLKRSAFMLILVFTQNIPLLQPLLIGLNSSVFAFYLFVCHPQQNHFHDFNQKLMEISIQICCFFFFLFEININHYQFQEYQSYQTFGWICIALISSCILSQFCCDLYQQVIYLRMKLINFQKQTNNQQNQILIHQCQDDQKESKPTLCQQREN